MLTYLDFVMHCCSCNFYMFNRALEINIIMTTMMKMMTIERQINELMNTGHVFMDVKMLRIN